MCNIRILFNFFLNSDNLRNFRISGNLLKWTNLVRLTSFNSRKLIFAQKNQLFKLTILPIADNLVVSTDDEPFSHFLCTNYNTFNLYGDMWGKVIKANRIFMSTTEQANKCEPIEEEEKKATASVPTVM